MSEKTLLSQGHQRAVKACSETPRALQGHENSELSLLLISTAENSPLLIAMFISNKIWKKIPC